jgi:hypothetical protein
MLALKPLPRKRLLCAPFALTLDRAGQVCHYGRPYNQGETYGSVHRLSARQAGYAGAQGRHRLSNNEPQPIKYVSEEELRAFSAAVQAIPYSTDPGYEALVNAKRAAFIVDLLGRTVGEECVSLLTHILDHVPYDVLDYRGEPGANDA